MGRVCYLSGEDFEGALLRNNGMQKVKVETVVVP